MAEVDLKVSIYRLRVCRVISAVSQLNGRKRAKGSSVYPSQQQYHDLSRRPIHHLNGASVEERCKMIYIPPQNRIMIGFYRGV